MKPRVRNTRDILPEIRSIHLAIKRDIEVRLASFRDLWLRGSGEELLCELVFCLLTPQSRARQCEKALRLLVERDLVFNGSFDDLSATLNIVRFRNTKAANIIRLRQQMVLNGDIILRRELEARNSAMQMREWLAGSVRGMGFKEASHFLRNIGLGDELAILDRHILKNLALMGVIPDIPSSLTPKRYLEMESLMRAFARRTRIPMAHLDFVLWYRETGDIFK